MQYELFTVPEQKQITFFDHLASQRIHEMLRQASISYIQNVENIPTWLCPVDIFKWHHAAPSKEA
jgi:hypothetical protein